MSNRLSTVLAAGLLVGISSVAVAQSDASFPGIEHATSQDSVAQVQSRLENALEDKGFTLFTVIDHSANAEQADMQLPPTRTVIFGNPKAGTPLMKCQGSTALDLPQKIVLRETDDGTRIEWNDVDYLAERHALQECDLPLDKIGQTLEGLAETAAGS